MARATMEATQRDTTMKVTEEARELSKRTIAKFKEEDKMKLVEFQRDNELLYNKRPMDHKDPNKGVIIG